MMDRAEIDWRRGFRQKSLDQGILGISLPCRSLLSRSVAMDLPRFFDNTEKVVAESDNSGRINRPEIANAWRALSNEVVSIFAEIPESDFAAERSGWSYAQNLDHLAKSAAAVAQALALPKLLIRLLFGTSTRSRSHDEVQSAYHSILDRGGQARGKFVPTGTESRDQLLRNWERISNQLLRNLDRWNEQQLDRLRLPHPLLGKLTVREMLYFTQFHTRNHLDHCTAKKASRHRS